VGASGAVDRNAIHASPAARPKNRRRYFVAVAAVLLAVVIAGFGRTFFGRAFFDVPPIPGYLIAHGFVLVSWFVLVVVQTSLVAAHRTDLHRRLGVLGGFVAAAVVVAAVVAVIYYPASVNARGSMFDGTTLDPLLVRTIVWTDLAALATFVIFVAAALYWRRRSDVHKRLMLLASIGILGPAVGRIAPTLALAGAPQWSQSSASLLLFIGPALSLVVYDVVARRRPHWATVVGIAVWWGLTGGAIAIAMSDAGGALISALESLHR
jgi:hypothetical protein